MSNYDTVRAITDNIQSVLAKEGIHFTKKAFDDEKAIPAGLLPLGRIFYTGEFFENGYGQRPLYAEAEFTIKVALAAGDPEDLVREQQKWAHKIRGALTVDALNAGDLAATRYVSRVTISRAVSENKKNVSHLACKTAVRYREV